MQALRDTDPRRIGPYTVLGRLGAGGMGEVFLAEARTGLRLAVKVVRAEHAEDRTFRARFRQEVRAAQTVGGAAAHVARVVDADTEGERPWMATEFVDGPNLRDAVLDHGPLPEKPVSVLAAALGEALTAIHAQGLVHRDLKPSNILLAADGPRVIDFGIVRALEATALTRTGTVVGSVGYVSPEQIRNNGQVGPPSDVFALGAVLAYAATGREPFGEGRDAVILMRILNRDFDLSGVPESIRGLAEPCLREDPEARPTPGEVVSATGYGARSLRGSLRPGWFTAAEPVEEEERWLPERDSGERASRVEYVAPVTVPDVPAAAPPAPPSRRRLLQGLAAGTLVAGAGIGGWLWLGNRDGGDGGTQGKARASASVWTTPPPQPAVVAWDYRNGRLSEKGGPCVVLSPGGNLFFGGVDGALHALSPDGRLLWKTGLGDPPLGGGLVGTPVVTADGAYCVQGGGMKLCAVDLQGRLRWERSFGKVSYDTLPVPAGELVLVSSDGTQGKGSVRAYRADGSLAWSVGLPEHPNRAPVMADGMVYVGSNSRLTVLDAESGTVLRKSGIDSESSPGRPALVGEDILVRTSDGARFAALGDLAVTTSEGPLRAVDPDDGSTVWTFQGNGEFEGSDPTVHQGLIYVFLGHTLYVVDGKGRLKRSLIFPGSPVLPEYRPVVGTHPAKGEHVYVAVTDGIAALDMSA